MKSLICILKLKPTLIKAQGQEINAYKKLIYTEVKINLYRGGNRKFSPKILCFVAC